MGATEHDEPRMGGGGWLGAHVSDRTPPPPDTPTRWTLRKNRFGRRNTLLASVDRGTEPPPIFPIPPPFVVNGKRRRYPPSCVYSECSE